MKKRTTAEWQALLSRAEVPHAPVMPLDEILATPQVAARQMVQELTADDGRKYRVIASPIHVGGEPFCSPLAPPNIGEHSDEILRDWLDYDSEKIQSLRASGAIS
jgi:crotonobetainyl-CoA:carnitine CoA-transferase CaiB-like acyl-CoA transferase